MQLLLTLLEQPNVLLLDEPTNDLDLDTLRALEDFLDDWPGIVVAVSHDRAFLDRTMTDVLALDGRGGARLVPGGVAGWLAAAARGDEGGPAPDAVREPALGQPPPAGPPGRRARARSAASWRPPSERWRKPSPGATRSPPSWRRRPRITG